MSVEHINSDAFEKEVLSSKGTVLVDFFATWCGPCKMLSPVLEKFAAKHEDIKVVKVDVDENEELAVSYGVQGVPTLLVFKDGELFTQKVGFSNEAVLEELVK